MKRFLFPWVILIFSGCEFFSTGDKKYLPEEIEGLRARIITLAESETCVNASEWDVVAFGSKPCGGPWSYLAYSKRINEREFLDLVAQYNELQRESNIKNKAVSDCAFVTEPSGVRCENGIPVFIYGEF